MCIRDRISKCQRTVETSTYGSELSAARVATEVIIELRYFLRMIGVPLEESSMMLGDNMSVIVNTALPSSVLKKKANAISYHNITESITSKFMKFALLDLRKILVTFLPRC